MTCTPTNIYGKFQQHLFLGLSVSSFSTSLDLSNNSSELTVRLVEDDCSSDTGKIYYDGSINSSGGTTTPGMPALWYGPDPGFTYPNLGCPCYFRLSYLKNPDDPYDPETNPYIGFEYCGLLQSYEEMEGEGGKTFVVKLTSPTEILHGTRLILEEYTDDVGSLYNVFNVYGYAESQGIDCPKITLGGANFGSDADAFGGSLSNSNGIPVQIIKEVMQTFCSTPFGGFTDPDYNPYGRLIFRGPGAGNDGYGVLTGDGIDQNLTHYFLDISELPVPADLFAARMNGTPTLYDFISELCSDGGYDWFCEILPTRYSSGLNNQICKIIKIQTIYRAAQPPANQISTFLNNLATDSGTVIASNKSIGTELRNEVMSSLIIGGQKESIYQATEGIYPYFGLHENLDTIETFTVTFTNEHTNGGNRDVMGIFVDITKLNLNLHTELQVPNDVPTNRVFVTIDEIRAAQEGEEQWRNWILNVNSKIFGEIISIKDFLDNEITIPGSYYNMAFGEGDHFCTFGSLFKNKLFGFLKLDVAKIDGVLLDDGIAADFNLMDFVGFGKQNGGVENNPTTRLLKDLTSIYRFVAGFSSYYGTKFMIKMPYDNEDDTVTIVNIDEYGVVTYSEEPTESGWPEVEVENDNPTEASNVIGLNTSDEALFFTNEQGKIECFVRFDSATTKDITEANLPDTWYYKPSSNSFYIKASVETGSFVFGNYSGYRAGATPEISPVYRSPRAVVSIDQPIREKIDEADIAVAQRLMKDMVFLLQYLENGNVGDADVKAKDFVKKIAARPNSAFTMPLKLQAYMPNAIALPIKSNVLNYGSWKSSTSIPGQTDTQIVSGLTPWEYGSLANMYAAGQYLADSKITAMYEAEKGSVTVPGIPTRPLGGELANEAAFLIESRNAITGTGYFGETNDYITVSSTPMSGTFGPNISNITASVGPDGFTTSYELRTYTSKFNRFGKLTLERFQRNGQNIIKRNRQALIKMKNNLAALTRSAGLKAGAGGAGGVIGKAFFEIGKAVGQGINAGINFFTGGAGSNLGVSAIPPAGIPDMFGDDFENRAIMSLDGLFRPAKRKTDSSSLNPYSPQENDLYVRHISQEVEPPLKADKYQRLKVDNRFLDPFACKGSPFFSGDDVDNRASPTHHDIQVLNSSEVPDPSTGNVLSLRMQDYNDLGPFDNDPNYRFLGLRGPLVISGWGYDTTGKPIPNQADTFLGSGGDFTVGEKQFKDKFADNFMEHPETWPVGPVDLRFDRKRGVWTCPPGLRIVRAAVQSVLNSSNLSADALMLVGDGNPIYNAEGELVEPQDRLITVHIPFQNDGGTPNGAIPETYASSGDVVVAYYNDVQGKYYALSVWEGAQSGECLKVYTDISCTEGSGIEAHWKNIYVPLCEGSGVDSLCIPTGTGCCVESKEYIQVITDIYEEDDCIKSSIRTILVEAENDEAIFDVSCIPYHVTFRLMCDVSQGDCGCCEYNDILINPSDHDGSCSHEGTWAKISCSTSKTPVDFNYAKVIKTAPLFNTAVAGCKGIAVLDRSWTNEGDATTTFSTIYSGKVVDNIANSSVSFATNLGSDVDLVGTNIGVATITFTSGNVNTETGTITGYSPTTGIITLSAALSDTPDNDSTFTVEVEYTGTNNHRFIIVECELPVCYGYHVLNTDMCPSDSTITLKAQQFIPIKTGRNTFVPATEPTIAKNKFGHAGLEDAEIYIVRDEDYNFEEGWTILDVKKNIHTVVISSAEESGLDPSCGVDVRTQQFAIETCALPAEPATIDISIPSFSFTIYNTKCNSETGVLEKYKANITVDVCGGTVSTGDWVLCTGGGDCPE